MELEKALLFATEKHKLQKRKFNGEPYVNHCIRVSNLVKAYSNNNILIISALLHDTIEDTDTTYDELQNEFGKQVADIVLSLTNDENELATLGKTEYLAQKINKLTCDELLIKLADRLDNLADLSDNDWSKQYAKQTKYVFFEKLDKSYINQTHLLFLDKIREKISNF